jgi:hypothetical protein
MITAAVMLSLVVRWRWVVQAVLFQKREVREAFAESTTLTRGLRWKLTWVLVGVVLVSLALGLLAPLLGDACTAVVLGVLWHGAASLAISFGVLLLVRTVLGAGCTFLGSCVDAGVFTSLYRRRLACSLRASSGRSRGRLARSCHPRGWLQLLWPGFATAAWLALDAIPDDDRSAFSARGVWMLRKHPPA